jgi:hypothetical protein
MLAVYRFAESFPDREKYGLGHQMRLPASPRALETAAKQRKLAS